VIAQAIRGARLLHGMVTGRPMHCIVQVSNRCNLTCGFCSFWENPARREDELTAGDFRVIAGKLAGAGSLVVSIEGGEPLLRPDITEIVAAFARHHHPILFSNGWRVTPDLARRLWDAGLDTAGISIDYPDPERHDRHRGKSGTFDRARAALDVLAATAPAGARQVFVMTVFMEDNAADMEALLELSASHGVGHQITLISTGGDGRHQRAQRAPAAGSGARLLELKRRHRHFMAFTGYLEGIDPYLSGAAPPRCHAGERFLNIDHLGDVSPCIEKLELRAGNLVREPWPVIAARLAAMSEVKTCRACWTSCRGFVEEMSGTPRLRSWREFFTDFSKVPRA
jgi:MoaA/NifB/PqqE/SkfB family radical SAM enzyme